MNRVFVAAPYVCIVAPFLVLAIAGAPLGHDLYFELVRVAAYSHAWQDGQLPPYWGGDLYAGWGSPIFLFYGHVYLVIASTLSVLASGYALGSALALACVTCFGVWTMQRAGSVLVLPPRGAALVRLPRETAALSGRVAAYVFLLNPYLLGDALLRNANAEYTALCALPLVVSGVIRCADEDRTAPLVLAAGLALVFSAHLLSAGITCALLALLVLCLLPGTAKLRSFFARVGGGFGLALLLSAFLWLPVLVYAPSIRTDDLLTGKFDYAQNFVPWRELVSSETFHGPGPAPLIALLAALMLVVRQRARLPRRALSLLVAWSAAVTALLLLQTAASAPVWLLVPAAKYLQFPWRLSGPLAFSSAMLAALVIARITQNASPRWRWAAEALVLAMCLVGAVSPIRQLRVLDHARLARFEHQLQRSALIARPQSATVGHEYLPQRAEADLAMIPATERSVLLNDRTTHVRTLFDEPRHLVVTVEATREQAACLARWGFEFWRLAIDGQPVPQIATKLGCLGVRVPAGTHRVEASLTMPWARSVGLGLSALGLCILVICVATRAGRETWSADRAAESSYS